jgi:hypothetical protein
MPPEAPPRHGTARAGDERATRKPHRATSKKHRTSSWMSPPESDSRTFAYHQDEADGAGSTVDSPTIDKYFVSEAPNRTEFGRCI